MIDILKPLFVYRKYLNAQKILKKASLESAVITENGKPTFVKLYTFQLVSQNMPYLKIVPERYLEALTELEKNKHINIWEDTDILSIKYQCTELGEIAINNGYYIKKVYLFWTKVVAIGVTSVTIVLPKLIEMIAKSL